MKFLWFLGLLALMAADCSGSGKAAAPAEALPPALLLAGQGEGYRR